MRSYEIGRPDVVKIAELSGEELAAPSCVFDSGIGKDLSNFAAIEMIELALGSQGVFMSSNGALSPEAATHNSELNRSRELTVEKMIFAVLSKRPPRL